MTTDHQLHLHRVCSWIQPVCSCGWVGSKHYAHNDYQYTNAREQWKRHVERSKD